MGLPLRPARPYEQLHSTYPPKLMPFYQAQGSPIAVPREAIEAPPGRQEGFSPVVGSRCAEKGCIFPAAPGSRGICQYHARLRREPARFHSQQPSCLLQEYAKFGITDPQAEYPRPRDGRRLARLRENSPEVA